MARPFPALQDALMGARASGQAARKVAESLAGPPIRFDELAAGVRTLVVMAAVKPVLVFILVGAVYGVLI